MEKITLSMRHGIIAEWRNNKKCKRYSSFVYVSAPMWSSTIA